MASPKPHVILIHGAWHQPWHLHLVSQQLETEGYPVSVPHLPSSSNTSPPIDNVFQQDVLTIRSTIVSAAATSDRLIVLGHSYGGVPLGVALAEVPAEVRAKVIRVIFLASFVVATGGALRGAGVGLPGWAHYLDDSKRQAVVSDPIGAFYHDVDPALAQEAQRRLLMHADDTSVTKTPAAGWKGLRCVLATCADDRAAPTPWLKALQQQSVQTEGGAEDWEYVDLEGGHSPFLARPEACVELIRRMSG